jgi:tetratricopeptide (TPR) repeat protein
LFGTTPVSELLAWLDENEPREGRDHWLRVSRAGALARLGRFDEARAILAEARADMADRGGGIPLATATGMTSVDVELLAGDPAAAAELGAEGCGLLDELGERSQLSTAAGKLAQALYALDRFEEADAWAGRGAELGASDDAFTQMLWRQVRAKVLARRGEHAEAERLAREAVAVGEETDMLDPQGDTHVDLAEVLLLAGKPDEAAATLEQALERYERKENVVMAGRTRQRLAEFERVGS